MKGVKNRGRVLAVAAGTGRVGYVFFVDRKLSDWGLSKKASQDLEMARAYAEEWIAKLCPNVVITEQVSEGTRKSAKKRALIEEIAAVAVEYDLHSVEVFRASEFANKYEEAAALGEHFPELAAWVPKKPKIWENEPRNTVYSDALALALHVVDEV